MCPSPARRDDPWRKYLKLNVVLSGEVSVLEYALTALQWVATAVTLTAAWPDRAGRL